MEAINSKSDSHASVPDNMLKLVIDRKRLNYNENLKLMQFGKSFHFYAIRELGHLRSYLHFLSSFEIHLLKITYTAFTDNERGNARKNVKNS